MKEPLQRGLANAKALKIFKRPSSKVNCNCNQMNAPCQKVQIKKGPHCVLSIRQEVGRDLHMQEKILCSCYGALLVRVRSLRSRVMPIYLFTEVRCMERSLEISVKVLLTCLWNGAKEFHFIKSTHLKCF